MPLTCEDLRFQDMIFAAAHAGYIAKKKNLIVV